MERFFWAVAVAALLELFAIPKLGAMEFERMASPGDRTTTIIIATGTIEPGDAERFRDILKREPPTDAWLGITSPGGNVGAALSLAAEIEEQQYSVLVLGECASACAQIIFPAGQFSVLASGSLLGIHSCSLDGVRNDICNDIIAKTAVQRGFPYGTLDMFSELFGPAEMKWISEIGARCFGYYHAPGDPLPIYGRKPCVDGVIYTWKSEAARRPFGPSFDCAKATTSVEQLFCDDKELMLVDSILGRIYDTARLVADQDKSNQIRKAQRAWIAKRNNKCAPLIPKPADFRTSRPGALCLYEENANRIYELIGEGTF